MTQRPPRRRKPPEHVSSTVRLDAGEPFKDEVARSVRSKFRPVLVVMSGEKVGTRVTLESSAVVGRDPAAELSLDDVGVSWHHAYVEDRGDSWAVVDEGSTNGTTVNGTTVDEATLAHGDKLVFGSTMVRFEVQDAADQAYDEFVARLLNVDELSGLYLKRRFDTELRAMLNQASLGGQPVGMLVMDLDGIKSINDTHGHSFGAYVIGEAGRVIGGILEGRGIACRWGGDEYNAALPGCDLEATVIAGEQIRIAIGSHPFEHDGVELKPGISIGAAAFPQIARDAEMLFKAADEALYRAKNAGKNRVST